MRLSHVPAINTRYWVGIAAASIFGTNLGDVFAFRSGLGILGGLPILAALVALVFLCERRDPNQHELWYWLVIIAIRTGATNIADFVCGGRFLGFNRVLFSALLAVFIALLVFMRRARARESLLPTTDTSYWVTMLAAGVFGTAAGDASLGAQGGPAGGGGVAVAVLLSALLVALLLSTRGNRMQTLFIYWLTICVARTAGTAIADVLAENLVLDLGLGLSTLMTGALFFAVVLLWRPARTSQGATP
jgi:uncharacterized membrane-anchored protein